MRKLVLRAWLAPAVATAIIPSFPSFASIDTRTVLNLARESLAPGIKVRPAYLIERPTVDENGLPAMSRTDLLQMTSITLNRTMGVCACSPSEKSRPLRALGQTSLKDNNGRRFAVSVVTFEHALRIFQSLEHGTWRTAESLFDGCYARAESMAYRLEKRGIVVGKVMAMGQFQILSDVLKRGTVTWGFHVAPIIVVDEGGQRGVWVLDPALFAEPVPLESWLALLVQNPRAKLNEVFLTNRFVFHPSHRFKNVTNWRVADLRTARAILSIDR